MWKSSSPQNVQSNGTMHKQWAPWTRSLNFCHHGIRDPKTWSNALNSGRKEKAFPPDIRCPAAVSVRCFHASLCDFAALQKWFLLSDGCSHSPDIPSSDPFEHWRIVRRTAALAQRIPAVHRAHGAPLSSNSFAFERWPLHHWALSWFFEGSSKPSHTCW